MPPRPCAAARHVPASMLAPPPARRRLHPYSGPSLLHSFRPRSVGPPCIRLVRDGPSRLADPFPRASSTPSGADFSPHPLAVAVDHQTEHSHTLRSNRTRKWVGWCTRRRPGPAGTQWDDPEPAVTGVRVGLALLFVQQSGKVASYLAARANRSKP